MERGGGAARAADADAGQPRTARAPGTEFRSGFGRHSYPSLGPIALTYPLADFLPFIEGPPLPTPGLKTWGFFWHVLRQVAPMARARGTAATNPPCRSLLRPQSAPRRRAATPSAALRLRRFPPDLGLGRENRRDFRGHVTIRVPRHGAGPNQKEKLDACVVVCLDGCDGPVSFGLWLQHSAAEGRGREGRLVGSGQPVSAAGRSHPEPRRDGEGLRGSGATGAGRGDRGTRQGRLHPGDAGGAQQSGTLSEVP